MSYRGKVHLFGDDVNTDEIIPAQYLNTTDRSELARHCMEGIRKGFSEHTQRGDIIVAGKNFGCGSSREHAPIAIATCGISCVIAKSFARIFFRNSINIGLPIIESPEAAGKIRQGDHLAIDTGKGLIRNITRKESYAIEKYPPFMLKIITSGGLMGYTKKRKR